MAGSASSGGSGGGGVMKGEQRRQQVMTCAAELFAERGYHRTTIEHIVKRAGIARGTFYLYFQDKRSIFEELLDRYMEALRGRITRIDTDGGREHALTQMRQNIRGIVEVCLEHRDLTRILLTYALGLDSEFERKLLDFDREVSSLLESSIKLGQQLGIVRACDPRLVAFAIIGAVKELMYQVTMRSLDVEVGHLVEELLALFRDRLLVLPVEGGDRRG
jgi:AcrR family transcriptional regulator